MRKVLKLSILISLTLVLLGCSWEIPERVFVKTNASYNFSIGNIEQSLDSSMDLNSILSSDKEGLTLYDYYPGKANKKLQQFVMTVKVYERDFTDMVSGNSTLSSYLAGTSDTQINLASLPAGASLAAAGQQELDFNPSEILNSMKEALGNDVAGKVEFASVPVYLYCNAGEGLSADAKVKMYYGKKDGSKDPITPNSYDQYIAGSSTEYTNISNAVLPEMTVDSDTSAVIIDLSEKPYSLSSDIAQIMNNAKNVTVTDSQLCLDYDLVLKGTVSKATLLSGNAKLTVYAAVVLPVKFNVLDNIEINVREFINSSDPAAAGSDIFGRTEATGLDDKKKYLDAIRCASLIYTSNALPFVAEPALQFNVDLLGSGNYNTYSLDAGVITLNYDDVRDMLNTYPLCPNLKIKVLKDASLSLPRNRLFNMNLSVNIVTDGSIQLF